jgi:hypothetical protein
MNPRKDYRPLSRCAIALTATAAMVASCASLSAVVGLFDSAGSTPWFQSGQADLVAHCELMRAATQRHACFRAVARQPATTHVAAR